MEEKNEYIIFHVEGGLGKNIAATAVVKAINNQYPNKKIVVVTAWEEAWYHNPNVYRVYKFGQLSYFYDDFVFDNTKIFRYDPYHSEDFILKRDHLVPLWCKQFGIEYNGEAPEMFLTPREIEMAQDKIQPQAGLPIMVIQTNGGAGGQYSKKSWARDIPIDTAQEIVDHYKNKYRILHIRREDQPALNNVEPLTLPLRELFPVLLLSSKRLLIDSFVQHFCAAAELPSVVCWVSNTPNMFGYDINKNIMPVQDKISKFNKYAYLEENDITGNISEYPYPSLDIFNKNEIIEAIDSI